MQPHAVRQGASRDPLPFADLPRGFVPWPQVVVDFVEREEARTGFGRFAEAFRLDMLTHNTLAYYYEDYDVAYRPAEGGIEVLGVGWEEASKYLHDPTVKVVVA